VKDENRVVMNNTTQTTLFLGLGRTSSGILFSRAQPQKVRKGKVGPRTGHKCPGEGEKRYSSSSFFYSPCYMGWVVNAIPRPLYPLKRDPVTLVQKVGLDPRLVWTGAENLASTGIRSPDRPARSESPCRPTRLCLMCV
jgi:hypothetical protein